jgi:hypothetical protein
MKPSDVLLRVSGTVFLSTLSFLLMMGIVAMSVCTKQAGGGDLVCRGYTFWDYLFSAILSISGSVILVIEANK